MRLLTQEKHMGGFEHFYLEGGLDIKDVGERKDRLSSYITPWLIGDI